MPPRIDVEIDIEKSRDPGGPGQTDTRRPMAKEVAKGGGTPPPWCSEVWKSSEIWNGGTKEGSTRSTERVGGLFITRKGALGNCWFYNGKM